jgi:hypothetical protein
VLQRLRRAQDQCEAVASEIIAWAGTIRRLAHRYFAGSTPLFPKSARELTELHTQVEFLVAALGEAVTYLNATSTRLQAPRLSWPAPVPFAALRARARPQTTVLTRTIADSARSKTALFMGDQGHAIALIGPQIWRDVALQG